MDKQRCAWCVGDALYERYHDEEWGVPVFEDEKLFGFLVLETFQAGLSWITILRKREHFRVAFDNFDYKKIATYSPSKVNALLQNKGIIRHQLKINATVTNAKSFMRIQKEFGSFSEYIWAFLDGKSIKNNFLSTKEIPSNTPLSTTISKDLKKRGFKFVGATVIYAYMQAIGMVNDHVADCFKHEIN